jgi:Ubiquitin carboxyl-terminal hydrolase
MQWQIRLATALLELVSVVDTVIRERIPLFARLTNYQKRLLDDIRAIIAEHATLQLRFQDNTLQSLVDTNEGLGWIRRNIDNALLAAIECSSATDRLVHPFSSYVFTVVKTVTCCNNTTDVTHALPSQNMESYTTMSLSLEALAGDNMFMPVGLLPLLQADKFASENIPGYQCIHCAARMNATITTSFIFGETRPQVLEIDFKRWHRGTGLKRTNPVHDIPEVLWVTDATQSGRFFRLKNFIVHLGAHYICFRMIDNQWYRFDDSVVRPCSFQDVQQAEAYTLTFEEMAQLPLPGTHYVHYCPGVAFFSTVFAVS